MRTLATILAFSAPLALSAPAFAHTQWMDPAPRTPCNAQSAMCKTAPCGGVAAVAPVKTFVVGSSYTLAYEETIEHAGHFRIALSTNGEAGFDTNVIADNLPDQTGTAPHDYTYTWTVPDTANCDPCVLQVTQFMSASSTYYYSCADIRILPAGAPTPTPTPGSSPTPTPGNGGDPETIHGSGCSCTVAGGRAGLGGPLVILGAVGLLAARRRRRRNGAGEPPRS